MAKNSSEIKGHITLIRGSKNITSTYQLDGKALLTTSLNQQDCNFLVERRYDNLNARLHALAKNRRWESVLDMIRESGHLLEPNWTATWSCDLNTALHFAAMDNAFHACEPLIKSCRFDPNYKNHLNQSAIDISAAQNNELMTKMLKWYKLINIWRRTYKSNLSSAKGRIVDSHRKYKKSKRKPKSKQDDFGDTKFSGKTVDQFKLEWHGLKSKLKYDKIKTNMQNKKLKKERKRKKRMQEKAMSEGFLF